MTMDQIIAAHQDAGMHFFDADSKRFFRSRIGSTVYEGPGGVYFVTSEQFEFRGRSAPRKYTVRKFNQDDASIDHVGEFNKLSRREAAKLAKKLARGEG